MVRADPSTGPASPAGPDMLLQRRIMERRGGGNWSPARQQTCRMSMCSSATMASVISIDKVDGQSVNFYFVTPPFQPYRECNILISHA